MSGAARSARNPFGHASDLRGAALLTALKSGRVIVGHHPPLAPYGRARAWPLWRPPEPVIVTRLYRLFPRRPKMAP